MCSHLRVVERHRLRIGHQQRLLHPIKPLLVVLSLSTNTAANVVSVNC